MRRTVSKISIVTALLASAAAFSQSLTVYSGNGQIALEQFVTNDPLTVAALDAEGNPITGLPITWSLTQGPGTIINSTAVTDSNGLSTASFQAGSVPGGLSYTQATVTASSQIGTASFFVTTSILFLPGGGTGALPLLQLVSPPPGNPALSGTAGSVLTGAVSVQLSVQSGPQAGTVLPNIGVQIYNYGDPSSTASGTCRGGTVLTDSTGTATCDLVLNNNLGEGQLAVIAGAAEISPSFFLTITPGTSCNYAIAPPGQSFTSVGGTGVLNLTAGSGCAWTAASNANWVVLTGAVAGYGTSNIGFAVATNSGPARTATITVGSLVFTVNQAAAGTSSPLTILTDSILPTATVGTQYALALQATGGAPPYSWSDPPAASAGGSPGPLAPGLQFGTAGVLGGNPTTAGTFNLTLQVTDSLGATQQATFQLTVVPATTPAPPVQSPGPKITTTSLPEGLLNQAYSQAIAFTTYCTTASSPQPTMKVSSGVLPPGLSLTTPAAGSWLIGGTPTQAGTFIFTLTVTEVCGLSGSATFTIAVLNAGAGPLITNTSFPGGSTGQVYKQAVTFTTSCTTPFSSPPTIVLSSGSLPPGLTLSSPSYLSWEIEGVPNVAGSFPFTLTITEVCGRTASQTYTIVVAQSAGGQPGGGILVSPNAVSITAGVGGSTPPPATTISLSSSTGLPVAYTASVIGGTGGGWLSIASGASGSTPASLSLSVSNFQNLAAGSYSAQLSIQAQGSVALNIPVTLYVSSASPLTVSPASLYFTSPMLQVPASLEQTVQVASASTVQFNVGFVSGPQANWLGASPASGSTPSQVTVVVNPVGLVPGTYTGTVQIAPPGGAPATIPVTLVVTPPPALTWSVPSVNSIYITGGPTPQPVTVNLASTSATLQFQVPSPQASWLSVSANSGTTPMNITLTFDPTGLAPGVYQASLTATPIGGQTPPVSLPVSFTVQEASPAISAIVNAASFLPTALAPGEEIEITGSGLGPVTQADATADGNGLFETSLAGASVYFNGVAAPVLHASDGQITVLVPYEIAGLQSAIVMAVYLSAQSAPQNFAIADSSPGLFTAAGTQGVILNADGTYNSLTNGASPGSVIGILGTGEGQTNPPGIDGLVMQPGALASPVLSVTAQINGEQAVVVSATSAPGQPAGIFLIQVQVPGDVPLGSVVPVSVTIGTASCQTGVTMAIAQQ